MRKPFQPTPVSTSSEIVVGNEYLLVLFYKATLVVMLVKVTKMEKEQFEYSFVRGNRVTDDPNAPHAFYTDNNVDGGGYNHHHMFPNTRRNLKFFLDLVLSQDWEKYLELY